jgi:hypothetical protein
MISQFWQWNPSSSNSHLQHPIFFILPATNKTIVTEKQTSEAEAAITAMKRWKS